MYVLREGKSISTVFIKKRRDITLVGKEKRGKFLFKKKCPRISLFVVLVAAAASAAGAAAAADKKDNEQDEKNDDDKATDDDGKPEPVKTRRDTIITVIVTALITPAEMEASDATTMAIAITRALFLALILANLHCDFAHILVKVITDVLEVHGGGAASDDLGKILSHIGVGLISSADSAAIRAQPDRAVVVGEHHTTNDTNLELLEELGGLHINLGASLSVPLISSKRKFLTYRNDEICQCNSSKNAQSNKNSLHLSTKQKAIQSLKKKKCVTICLQII